MGAFDCVTNSGKITFADSTEVFTVSMESNSTLNIPRRDLESQISKSSTLKRHSVWWHVLIDGPLLILVLVFLILFEYSFIPSHKAGFFCNDPSLSYPFTGDTVAMGTIVATVLLFPVFIIFITEVILMDSDYSLRSKIVQSLWTMIRLYRNYVYGMFMNLAIVEVMKGITGSPRPTFFDLCEPDTAKTCTGSEYVSMFQCTSQRYDTWYQTDSYHSFPSGHASLSVYCGFFIAWYLQRRAFDWYNRSVFLVPVLQMLCAAYAAICSLTRITDHRHHWWDVLVGVVIGVGTLVYAVIILSDNFSQPKRSCSTATEESEHTGRTLLS